MFVSVLAGLGVASVMMRVRSAHLRYALVAIATVMVIAESLNRPFVLRTLPPNIPAVYEWLRAAPPGVVVVPGWRAGVTIGPQDPTYMYYSTAHWKPLLNGYSGFAPPSYSELLEGCATSQHRVDRLLACPRGEVPARSRRVLHQRRVRAGCRGAGAADGRAPRGAVSQRRVWRHRRLRFNVGRVSAQWGWAPARRSLRSPAGRLRRRAEIPLR